MMKTLIVGLLAVVGFAGCALPQDQEATRDQAVLDPPTGITATAMSSTRISASWNPVAGATLYYIYLAQGSGPFSPIAAVHAPDTTFDATGLTPGTTYSISVASFDPADGQQSNIGTPATVTTQLDGPTGVTATPTSSSRITVTWNTVPDATLYYIYRSDAGGPFNAIAAVHAPEITFDAVGLAPLTTYCFEIQSFNDGGTSALSEPGCAVTPDATGGLLPPTGVAAVPTSSSRITVTWVAAAGATLYYVYRSDDGGPFNAIAATADTTFESAGLAGSTTYCYEIQSFNTAGVSALSQPPACASTGASGLAARWKFDERTGGVANDASGNTFTGILQGGTAFNQVQVAPLLDETAHNRSSLAAPGGAGDFVSVTDNGSFSFDTGDFTVSLWVNAAANGVAGTVHLIGKRAPGCGATGWELGIQSGAFFFSGAATATFGTIAADTWTHVAVTSSAGALTFYVNGLPVGTGAFTAGAVVADPLEIGNAGGCTNSSAVLIDEARIFATALSAGQVSALGKRPPAPQNLSGVVVSTTQANLSWAAVAGAEMYIVYRGSASGNEAFLTTQPATSTQYIEGHLTPQQTTSWQVVAVVGGLVSPFSNEVVLTSNPPPPPPTNVAATGTSQSQIDVTWTAEPVATVYYIFQSTANGPFVGVGAVTAPTTTFTAANLSAGTTYQFAVASMDSGQTIGAQSAPVSGTTLP